MLDEVGRYEGMVLPGTDIRHGYGTNINPAGDQFWGYFKDDVQCGHGRFIYGNGFIDEGEFFDGRLIRGKITHPDGTV